MKMIKIYLGVRDYISLAEHCWIESQEYFGDRLKSFEYSVGKFELST